jgi:hypothetical protein
MSITRAYRLLGAVEAGTVSGSQLETYLADLGRSSEFNVLLAMRGQARRMASSPVTMAAITNSPRAVTIVYQQATATRFEPLSEVVRSSVAMQATSLNRDSLLVLAFNPVAWTYYKTSIYYEANLSPTIANFASLPVVALQSVNSLITEPGSMGNIATSLYAMRAIVASANATTILAGDVTAMSAVADSQDAIRTVAEETKIMPIIAGSAVAMGQIVSRSYATTQMASNVGAIQAISKVAAAWATYLAGPYFATNLPTALANLIGVDPINYPTLDSIIADATALAKVAANQAAVQALASNSAAMTTLANSPNIGIILGSAIAMGVIGPNTTAMSSFLGVSGAWAGLFASSVAKGYIVASTPLVNVVAANSALITYLNTIAVKNVSATGIPDGNATTLQPFNASPALPAKLLTLSAKEVGIAATYSNYNFGGSALAGSQAGATLSLSGTGAGGQPTHVAGYSGMTWNFQGVGVTAATLPIITYVDMT